MSAQHKYTPAHTVVLAIATILPVAMLCFCLSDLYQSTKESVTPDIQFIVARILVAAGAVIFLIRTVQRMRRRRRDICPFKAARSAENVLQRAYRDSPFWELGDAPSFPVIGLLLTFVLLAMGSMIFFMPRAGYDLLSRQFEARQWPATQGVVIHSPLTTSSHAGFNRDHAGTHVAYSVGNTHYQLNEPYVGQSHLWRDKAANNAQRSGLKPPAALPVYYNPASPKVAVTDAKLQTSTMLYGGIALATYCLGLFSAYYSVDQLRRFLQARKRYSA